MHFLELQRLPVQLGPLADAFELPRRHVREVRVVAQRLTVRRLALLAEVAAARFAPVQRVKREELRELEIVSHATGVLEALIEVAGRAWHRDAVPELVPQLRNLLQRARQARFAARHPDVVPHDASELP